MITTILTQRERKELEAAAEQFARELEEAVALKDAPPPSLPDPVTDLYGAIEEDNLEEIRFRHECIGLYARLRERFREDRETLMLLRYLTNLEIYGIEETAKEIENDRDTKARLGKLPGARPDHLIPRDEDPAVEGAGGDHQGQELDLFS